MTRRALLVAAVLATTAFAVWRAQLFTVSRPGERPRPLVARALAERTPTDLDVVLPAVPIGMRPLPAGAGGVPLPHLGPPGGGAAGAGGGARCAPPPRRRPPALEGRI